MAVFRLSLLLQVGFVIGSDPTYADWSEAVAHGRQLAQLRAPETAPLPQKTEAHLPGVVTAFLHTGDSSALKRANCSQKYELTSLRGRSRAAPHLSMSSVLDTVLHATNFLNTILQANRSREHHPRRDMEWYHALVRSILAGDTKIHRAVVTFGGEFLPGGARGAPPGHQIRRGDSPPGPVTPPSAQPQRGHGVVPRDEGHQDPHFPEEGSRQILCERPGQNARQAAFYGLKSDLVPEFRGVVRVDVNLQDVDIDQCSADGWFAGTHRCNLTTMECLPLRGHGFVLDKYQCHCKKGFYHPSRVAVNGFTKSGRKEDAAEGGAGVDEGSSSDCLPCQQGCTYCKDDAPCVAQEDGVLRLAVLSFQCLCMLIVFISMVLVYHFRRNK
ncbi:putative G-protein coupled receptor 158, partial [Oryzias melastigma]